MADAPAAPGARLAIGLPVTAGVLAALIGGVNAAWLGVASGVLAGLPAAYWAITTGRTRLYQWLCLGAAAGVVPLLVPLAAALLKESAHGHPEVLRQGMGFIVAGMLSSLGLPRMTYFGTSFPAMELLPMGIGILTAACYWTIFVRIRH